MRTTGPFSAGAMLLGMATCGAASVLTGPIRNPSNSHDYYLISAATWNEAESHASTLDGHLASIGDAAEQAWIVSNFAEFGAISRSLWIGLSDSVQEGIFQWVNGDSVTYSNWASGQPSSSTADRDFVAIMSRDNKLGFPAGTWITLQNNNVNFAALNPIYGVAEVIPEPATTWLLLLPASLLLGGRSRAKKPMTGCSDE